MSLPPYERPYGIHLIDDLHNYFPAILYDSERFTTTRELMTYIQTQMAAQFNTFTLGRNQYYRQPQHTVDITPIFTTDISNLLNLRNQTPQDAAMVNLLQNLLNIPQEPNQFLNPVVVRPTREQIDRSTSLRVSTATEANQCAICQEAYVDGQGIRRITRCTHEFHLNCIEPWFQRNVHCPVCRHDIRQV
jgi:hypothetical protein